MEKWSGLRTDFVRQNGVFMTVEGNERPLAESDLCRTALRMLEHNAVSGVLPLHVERMDFTVTLKYRITGKKLLSQELRGGIDPYTFYRLLIRTATIVLDSRAYLLDEDRFVLDSDAIFLGDRWEDVHLVYLPLVSPPDRLTAHERWKRLLAEWMEAVDGLSADEWRELLADGRRSDWDLAEMRAKWIRMAERAIRPRPDRGRASASDGETDDGVRTAGMRGGSDERSAVSGGAESREEPSSRTAGSGVRQSGEEGEASDAAFRSASGVFSGSQTGSVRAGASEDWSYIHELLPAPDTVAALESFGGTTRRRRTPGQRWTWVALAAVLLVLIGFLFPAPETGWLAGGGVAVLAVGAGLWYRKLAKADKDGGSVWSEAAETEDGPEGPDGERDDGTPSAATAPSPAAALSTAAAATTVLSPRELTVALPSRSAERAERAYTALAPLGGQKTEWRTIASFPFVIGRDAEAADWSPDVEGMSRLHCEIAEADGVCTIRDLGSTNGTRLNGELLVPFKRYALQHEDRIGIAGKPYVFIREFGG